MVSGDELWPPIYHSKALNGRFLAVETSLIWAGGAIAATPKKAFRSFGIVVAVLAGGLALSALDRFREDWLIYFLLPVAPLVLGVVGGTFATLSRTRSLVGWRTVTEVHIVHGVMDAYLNGHRFSATVGEVRRIRRLPGAAVIEYDDDSVVVVPREAVRDLMGWRRDGRDHKRLP
jgi:hypothetical protein